ncbi:MAG: hypothetical protein ACI8R9_000622 [Paraglaciecola sp.]|jgi:uncharacterized secreted protein with C-terminal beta-propeller domain
MKYFIILAPIILLSACGGSDAPTSVDIDDPDSITLPIINLTAVSLAKLKPATATELKNLVQNGLYRDSNTLDQFNESTPVATTADNVSTVSNDFSVTVTAEAGVDEIDTVKYNGNYLYVLDNQSGNDLAIDNIAMPSMLPVSTIRTYERQNDDSLIALNTVEDTQNKADNAYTQGMYTYGDDLITIGTSSTYGYWALDTLTAPSSERFFFNIYNMSEPNDPLLTETFSVEGYLLDSRRVDQYLILVSSFSPSVTGYNFNATTDEEREGNLTLLEATTVDDLLPKYTINDQAHRSLVSANNCYIPDDTESLDGHAGVVTLTVVDLSNPAQTRSICVNGYYDGMYASKDAVILFGQSNQKNTVLHHFNFISPQFTYNGSAVVPGYLGWNQPQLRLSINDNHLRVVSTEFTTDEDDRLDHTLSIFNLDTNNAELALVGQLPNAVQTDEIGKPNEDIMAVRFFSNKGYVVTFERIDPFYVIDLADPGDPHIVGELEMPGYSSYLQPINDNYVLSIGQNVDPNRFISDSPIEEALTEGAKVALFDVSGTPRIVNEYVFANAGTPVEFNYKALTYLPVSETEHWFAMPMISWDPPVQPDVSWTKNNRLELFEVDLLGNGAMKNSGRIAPDFRKFPYFGGWDDRAVIHNDKIYYVHGGRVWQANWSSPETLIGPL